MKNEMTKIKIIWKMYTLFRWLVKRFGFYWGSLDSWLRYFLATALVRGHGESQHGSCGAGGASAWPVLAVTWAPSLCQKCFPFSTAELSDAVCVLSHLCRSSEKDELCWSQTSSVPVPEGPSSCGPGDGGDSAWFSLPTTYGHQGPQAPGCLPRILAEEPLS